MSFFPLRGSPGESGPAMNRRLTPAAVTVWIVVAACCAAAAVVAVLALQTRIPFSDLTRDPLAIMGKKGAPHLGFLSNLGALVWCTTAAVCAFTALRLASLGGARRQSSFLFVAAAFTSLLLFDDLFMLHENLRLRVAWGELALFALYGGCALSYGLAFRGVLQQLGFFAPLLAICLLGISVAVDVSKLTATTAAVWPWILEDGSKFVGLVVWGAFHIRAAWIFEAAAARSPGPQPSGPQPSGPQPSEPQPSGPLR